MTDHKQARPAGRRGFLKRVLTLGGGAAMAAVATTAPAAEVSAQPGSDRHDSGYQETPHVLDYYDKARF